MIVVLFIAAALIVISLVTLLNTFMFPRLSNSQHKPKTPPFVSILIPARNEAAVIGETLRSLVTQAYPHFEVILLDDGSTDDTGEIAHTVLDTRLRIVEGQPLPAGWSGKNWACHQLSQMAQGDVLVFSDADVRWSEAALMTLIGELERTNADLFTVWSTQTTITWGERLVVPLMALAIIGYLPVVGTHYTPFSMFAAACGQCMAWRRKAYYQVGGHEAVRDNVLEDVTMARLVKRRGLRLRMADGAGLIGCRMYTDWQSVRDGYAKNILAGYGNSVFVLLLATVFHWLTFILPPLWLLTGWVLKPDVSNWFAWALMLTLLGVGVRMLTAVVTRQRVLDGLLMPVSVVLMTVIAFQAIYWRYRYGGPNWKGRVITLRARI